MKKITIEMAAMEFLLLGIVVILTPESQTVPVLNNHLTEEDFDEEDFTTHTLELERLSSAATCLVADVEYTHGQQIYRKDPCEFCLCLDGEMFCWWQECSSSLQDDPCRNPFVKCFTEIANDAQELQSKTMTGSSTIQSLQETSSSEPNAINTILTSSITESTDGTLNDTSEGTTETPNTIETIMPKMCIIMGHQYEIGSKLPHDTGNCIECICGDGAKVACSPNNCAPASEDNEDYRPPRSRQPITSLF